MGERIWTCKIGGRVGANIPPGADFPMRKAVERAFHEITGCEAEFTFSGWGGSLTEPERAVVEDRLPSACTCTVTGVGSAGGRVLRPNDSCPVHTRSPQGEDHEGEDHEGEVEASDPRHNAAYRAVLDYCSHGIVGVGPFEAEAIVRLVERAVLSRVSSSRDGTVGEDHEARDEQGRRLYPTVLHGEAATAARLAEHSPSRDGTVAVDHEQLQREVEQLRAHDDERVELAQEVGRLRAEVARLRDGTVAYTHVCMDCGALGVAGGYHDHGNGNAGDTIALAQLPEAIRSLQQFEQRAIEAEGELARDGTVAVEDVAAKLNEMALVDETRDPHDEGYMAAVVEVRDWLAEFARSATGEQTDHGGAPGVGLDGKLICQCEHNRTYCPHAKGECPWWDREPVKPTWHRADHGGDR